MNERPHADDDTPALPESTPDAGQPDQGDNQDVSADRIYPTDPTGTDPT
jgi:hypothetical protein